MNNEELNTALYEKLFAEQETYRAYIRRWHRSCSYHNEVCFVTFFEPP